MVSITHLTLVNYFRDVAEKHVDINGFYRFDINEIQARLRSGTGDPCLMLEAAEIDWNDNGAQNKSLGHTFAFSIMGEARKDDHDKVNEVLDSCQQTALEVERRILRDSENPEHWLYNRYDANMTSAFKVGPLFGSTRWGYRISITLVNTDRRIPTPGKWSDL